MFNIQEIKSFNEIIQSFPNRYEAIQHLTYTGKNKRISSYKFIIETILCELSGSYKNHKNYFQVNMGLDKSDDALYRLFIGNKRNTAGVIIGRELLLCCCVRLIPSYYDALLLFSYAGYSILYSDAEEGWRQLLYDFYASDNLSYMSSEEKFNHANHLLSNHPDKYPNVPKSLYYARDCNYAVSFFEVMTPKYWAYLSCVITC